MASYKHQLAKLYTISFLVGFVLWYGVEKLFLQNQLGVGPSAIAAIIAIYMTLTLVLDVPAGVLADRWGRKNMLVAAIGFFIAADIVLGSSTSFLMYCAGTVLWGLFTVSYYGTYEALLFDTAKHLKRKGEYSRINATQKAYFMLGIAISSILAGFIASQLSMQASYYLSIIPLLIAGVVALSLTEPPRDDGDDESIEEETVSHWKQTFRAIKEVAATRVLRSIALSMLVLMAMQNPIYEFGQYVYMAAFNGDPFLVAVVNGVGGLMLVVGFLLARCYTGKYVVFAIAMIAAIALMAVLQNIAGVGMLMIALLLMPLMENTVQVSVQHAVTSKRRATMTSAINFVSNVFVVPFAFVFAYVAEHASIWTAYGMLAAVAAVILGIYLVHAKSLPRRA